MGHEESEQSMESGGELMTDKPDPAAVPETTDFLKPCPFCGGGVDIERATDTYEREHGWREWWGVVCRNTINLGGTCAIQQIPSASKEAAIERWNHRAPTEKARMAESREHAGEQPSVTSDHSPLRVSGVAAVSPAPDKALPEPKRYTHPHFGPVDGFVKAEDYDALRQRAVEMWDCYQQLEDEARRDGPDGYDPIFCIRQLRQRANDAESALTAERQKNEGL